MIGNLRQVMRVATGDEEEEYEDDGKDPASKALGAKGGKARAATPHHCARSEIAHLAAEARWRKC